MSASGGSHCADTLHGDLQTEPRVGCGVGGSKGGLREGAVPLCGGGGAPCRARQAVVSALTQLMMTYKHNHVQGEGIRGGAPHRAFQHSTLAAAHCTHQGHESFTQAKVMGWVWLCYHEKEFFFNCNFGSGHCCRMQMCLLHKMPKVTFAFAELRAV